MRRALFVAALLLGTLAMTAGDAQAQVEKKGQAGFRFLENPISAEAVGRGGVGTTMLRNSAALFWNPAGIAWIDDRLDVGIHYTSGIAEMNQMSAAIAYPVRGIGVFGVSVTNMDYGTFYRTRRADNDQGFEETGTFSPSALAVGVAFGRAMSDRFSFGVQLKVAHQNLGDAWIAPYRLDDTVEDPRLKAYAMTVPAVDVGASYDFQTYGLTFGAAVQNVSQEVRYENEQFPLPFGVRFSLTASPMTMLDFNQEVHDFVIAVESVRGRDFGTRVQTGAEYTFMDVLALRGGYMGGYSERGMTLGLGLRHSGFRFDYAFQEFGVFKSVHMISLGYALGR